VIMQGHGESTMGGGSTLCPVDGKLFGSDTNRFRVWCSC